VAGPLLLSRGPRTPPEHETEIGGVVTNDDDDVVLRVDGVTKRFPGVTANADVGLELRRGEIHCLLGENGAGKSTLVNVVYGLYQPDEGSLWVHGRQVSFNSSADAIAAGIGMVHQHFQLIPVLSVTENIILGKEVRRGAMLDMATAHEQVRELSRRYGLDVDPGARVESLSIGAQQRVELLKALYRDAEILILDEPTAVLTPREVDEFFAVVDALVDSGKSVIFITHKLKEVLAVADRVTVLRGGRVVGTADPSESSTQSLATMMVGREVSFDVDKRPASPGEVVLEVEGVTVADDRAHRAVADLDLTVRAGEILGIAGVEGNGQRELVEAIAGMRMVVDGDIRIGGRSVVGMSPRDIEGLGVGHVPEDRSKHGIVKSYPITDNLVLNRYHRAPFSKRWVMNRSALRRNAEKLVERYDVRTPGVDVPIGTLSGGNQQKVVVARELAADLELLLVAQPTRGLDVGSIEFIHSRIVEKRDEGTAVLLVSAELDEILSLADRVAVLYRGRIVDLMDRDEATRERLGLAMAGSTPSREGVA
jgi:simple sugar transport system ATP-binding protein